MDGPLDPDETVNLLSGSGCHQCDTHQYHLCRKALTFDELMTARGLVIPQGALSRSRNHSAIFYHYASLPEAEGDGVQFIPGDAANWALRKTRSAESVLCKRPKIIIQDSMDRTKEIHSSHDENDGMKEKLTNRFYEYDITTSL